MIRKLTVRLTVVGLVALSAVAHAQFDGLDLTDPNPPTPKKSDKPKKAGGGVVVKEKAAPAAPATKKDEPAGELDLSSTADVKGVLIVPPVVKVTASAGGFSGFDTKKTSEKFDFAAHKRIVTAFERQLEGKVVPAELTQGVLTKEGITTAMSKTPAGLQKLARATNVAYMVVAEFNKNGALVAVIFDASGKTVGQPTFVTNAAGIPQRAADDMAAAVSKELAVVAKAAAAAEAKALAAATAKAEREAPAPLPAEDEINEPVSAFETVAKKSYFDADRSKTRLVVSVGPGAVLRTFNVSGDRAASLAELRNNGIVGLGVYAQISPLQFFDATAGKKYADLEIEVNWRRAFVTATGTGGDVEGTPCSMTDDDLQIRGTYRYKVGDGTYLPSVGVGGGFSQERTTFQCNLPLVSTAYRGIDAQLRLKQPLYNDILALDLAVGPRFLFSGPQATPGFSIAGEAWFEAKPVKYLFGRAGGRVSRLQVSDGAALAVVDTRMFFGLEVGAFF